MYAEQFKNIFVVFKISKKKSMILFVIIIILFLNSFAYSTVAQDCCSALASLQTCSQIPDQKDRQHSRGKQSPIYM